MTANTLRSFAFGLLVATGICGAVYFLTPDASDDKSTQKTVQLSEEEMKDELSSQGYIVLTNDQLKDQISAAQEKESDKKTENQESDKVVYRTMLTVTSGMTSIDVGNALANAHVIASSKEFSDLVERRGLSQALRPGTFEIQSDMTLEQVIAVIFKKEIEARKNR
ncbi:hypothetical protein [Bacillus testis]|uniref:hypothetical protein n=1 Tax=Bacillus testis TaxID=1622072 RepID=UPI00067F4D31|nr:hypothetical protein [Bacillus testis]